MKRSKTQGLILMMILVRSEEHTSELQSRFDLVCRLLLASPHPSIYTFPYTTLFRSEITRIDTSDYNVHIAGELKDFDGEEYFGRKEARRMDRFTQYAVAASDEAVKDSGLDINDDIS